MIIDQQLRLSDAQALTSTGTTASTNVVDLSTARDLGFPDPKALRISVFIVEAFTSGGSATLQVAFQGSVDNSAWTSYVTTPTMAVADLTLGRNIGLFGIPTMPPGVALPRYWRLAYIIATAAFTAGKVTSDLVLDRPNARAYPPGLAISN